MLELNSEDQTRRLGEALGLATSAGLVVGLIGELGAGKTRFVQGVAAGLGVDHADVNSPTFILIQEYEGRLPLYHFDAYRLRDTDEFLELGADEYMSGDGVCLIEWADRVADVLPRDRVTIRIEITGETQRTTRVSAGGPRSKNAVDRLKEALDKAN